MDNLNPIAYVKGQERKIKGKKQELKRDPGNKQLEEELFILEAELRRFEVVLQIKLETAVSIPQKYRNNLGLKERVIQLIKNTLK